jgi:hypothetical protein
VNTVASAFRVRDRSGKPAGLIARRNDEATGRGLVANSPTALHLSAGTPKQKTSTWTLIGAALLIASLSCTAPGNASSDKALTDTTSTPDTNAQASVTSEQKDSIYEIMSSVDGVRSGVKCYPIGTPLTDTVIVTGVIREQSSAGFYCGTVCHSGTIKIEVTRVERGIYRGEHLFTVIGCFVHDDKDLGKKIRMIATPLTCDRDIGCFANVVNRIDSKGVPFYWCHDYHIYH